MSCACLQEVCQPLGYIKISYIALAGMAFACLQVVCHILPLTKDNEPNIALGMALAYMQIECQLVDSVNSCTPVLSSVPADERQLPVRKIPV